MILYNFVYYQPATIEETIKLFHSLDTQGKNPIYFPGGIEVIILSRLNRILIGAVIKSLKKRSEWS